MGIPIWPRAVVLLALAPLSLPAQQQSFRFAREHVLGTSMAMVVDAGAEPAARAAEEAALAEIDRLVAVLSRYEPTSELSRFSATRDEPVAVSKDLMAVLSLCDAWTAASGGIFEPGVGALEVLWADSSPDEDPAPAVLEELCAELRKPQWRLDAEAGTAVRLGNVPFDTDGLAKGYVIDSACRAARREADGVESLLLDIGGDLMALGDAERVIAVVDPRSPAENAPPLCRVRIRNEAVATSGDYARSTVVRGERRSHILDPRTGRHAVGIAGSTVIAPDATTADAVATILSVLAPADGVAFVDARPGIECLVVAPDGKTFASRGWAERVLPDEDAPASAPGGAWPEKWAFAVEFEIADPSASAEGRGGRGGRRGGRGGARRPYVAVWIEDSEGHAVRTLCLWIEQERWLRDLRRWSRLNGRQRSLIDAVSRATRRPGSYSLEWDGKDDAGAAVPPGEYVVLIEAVREHGTYQLMRQPVAIDGSAFDHRLDGNVEIAGAHVRFGAPQESSR